MRSRGGPLRAWRARASSPSGDSVSGGGPARPCADASPSPGEPLEPSSGPRLFASGAARGPLTRGRAAQMMAVADGVAGWWEAGIDSGQYSRQLLTGVKEAALGLALDESPDEGPVRAL